MTEQSILKDKKTILLWIRELGSFLSSVIMPNLNIFIVLGFINLLTNYVHGDNLVLLKEVEELLMKYVLPLLIGYTGGKKINNHYGGAIAGIATIGVIVATVNPSIFGAMFIGPLAVIFFNVINNYFQKKIKNGYEMLLKNILAGFVGTLFCFLGLVIFMPLINNLTVISINSVSWLVTHHLLPFISIIIEPLKVLFFNNAINHGLLTPLGLSMVKESGKSILFLLEANPGPGFGILLVYLIRGNKKEHKNIVGASFIQLFGGIHEIYFPFILMNPRLILPVIISGITGTAVFEFFDVDLLGPVSPGSIILIFANAPQGNRLGIFLGVVSSILVSFVLGIFLFKGKNNRTSQNEIQKPMKKVNSTMIEEIIIACDAGIGSSAMGASLLNQKLQESNFSLVITNQSVYQVDDKETSLVLIHPQLKEQLLKIAPSVNVIEINNFLDTEANVALIKAFFKQEKLEVYEEQTQPKLKQLTVILPFEKNIRGSQTMVIELMRNRAEKQHVEINFKKEKIETLTINQGSWYIVSEEFDRKYQFKIRTEKVLIMSDLFSMSEFERWLKGV